MPKGTVHDDGDPGMKGQRIGYVGAPDADNSPDDWFPFNNGRLTRGRFYLTGYSVIYIIVTASSGRKYAEVIRRA